LSTIGSGRICPWRLNKKPYFCVQFLGFSSGYQMGVPINAFSDLNKKQIEAIEYLDSNLRILAGPGTGKSRVLTEKIIYLILEKHVDPSEIVALTFTRASANDLRVKLKKRIPNLDNQLRVSTLHSFCLRQLLRNSKILDQFPKKFRIADDWEERWIIQEDIKNLMGASGVKEIQDQLNLMSADWQSLTEEVRDPHFIGAWIEHKKIFRYVLRSEIVYQLKKSLDHYSDEIDLETPIRFLIVDEFQDLNKCDQAIIKAIAQKGAKIIIAGDDDQSIYGFRKAYPSGIRNFNKEYPGSKSIELEICYRCDSNILNISQFVADLDTERPKKKIKTRNKCPPGIVKLIKNRTEADEANTIAKLCKQLITNSNYKPEDILILIRSNNKNAYSTLFGEAFEREKIPFTDNSTLKSPIQSDNGRLYYALLRLINDKTDDLAWQTVLKYGKKGIGPKRINFLYKIARDQDLAFSELINSIYSGDQIVDHIYMKIKDVTNDIFKIINDNQLGDDETNKISQKLKEMFCSINNHFGLKDDEIENFLISLCNDDIENFPSYMNQFYEIDEKIEQVISPGKVNLLTMHQAKGLTSDVVIIPVTEDEVIPGKNLEFERIGDERRLLYVSLSRACHHLYISYCINRVSDPQKYLGRNPGNPRRHLTRFLTDSPLIPIWGDDVLDNFQ